jgi:hypothetical protein
VLDSVLENGGKDGYAERLEEGAEEGIESDGIAKKFEGDGRHELQMAKIATLRSL